MRDGSVFSKSMAGFLAALLSAGIMLTGCGSGPAASSGPEETAVENTTVSQVPLRKPQKRKILLRKPQKRRLPRRKPGIRIRIQRKLRSGLCQTVCR